MDRKDIKRKELLHLVNKLHTLFFHADPENRVDLELAIKIVESIFRWQSCEGLHGLKRAKAMSNFFVRHLMGTPLESVPLSNRYKRLVNQALLQCGNTQSKIYWVSVFSAFRLFMTDPVVDVSTITGRFEGRLTGLLTWRYVLSHKQVIKSFRSSIDQNWSAKFKWHISGATGPNGPVAYTQYLNDLRSLSYSWLLLGQLILFGALPYDNKRETVKALRDVLKVSNLENEEGFIHSRLAFLSDKGGKTRVVALGDILSQSLLQTVHHRCNLILRRLSQDGTFDQDSSRRYIKKLSRDNVPLASIDLTAATDRMPVLFQVWVLISLRILTPLQALGWWWVTTRRTFVFKNKGNLKRVRYRVGQPMGLLSSWPVMAISHHYLVRLAFAAQGFKPRTASYRVLGDDLTLSGFEVAGEYLKLISYLGMDFSPEKTYISVGVAEFAKSLFCHGEDLTPFPLALLRFNINTLVSNTLAIITESKSRNLGLTLQRLTGLFPKRWRNTVLLAALSPSSPRYGLDVLPRSDHWVFLQFIYAKRIEYFSQRKTVEDSIHAFWRRNPEKCLRTESSPFIQIAVDNGNSYPVRYFRSKRHNLTPEILLGLGWTSYCTKAWPTGLPPVGASTLIPGPSWLKKKEYDNFFRSSLSDLNKLLPDYFTVRCVGKQVGE